MDAKMQCYVMHVVWAKPKGRCLMFVAQEQMMRKKNVMHLDGRHVTMIENAFYYCNPPEVQKSQEKARPPMQEFTRKLIFKDLSKVTTEKVVVWF